MMSDNSISVKQSRIVIFELLNYCEYYLPQEQFHVNIYEYELLPVCCTSRHHQRFSSFIILQVDNVSNAVSVLFTPTIPHCSMATLIGLSIRVKLLRSLPPRYVAE